MGPHARMCRQAWRPPFWGKTGWRCRRCNASIIPGQRPGARPFRTWDGSCLPRFLRVASEVAWAWHASEGGHFASPRPKTSRHAFDLGTFPTTTVCFLNNTLPDVAVVRFGKSFLLQPDARSALTGTMRGHQEHNGRDIPSICLENRTPVGAIPRRRARRKGGLSSGLRGGFLGEAQCDQRWSRNATPLPAK